MSACFFVGHRETGERMLPALAQEVERHITEYGVTEFVVGHYGGFDRLAASAVREAKKRHPEITLTLLLPYTTSSFLSQRALTAPFIRRAWRPYPSGRPLSGQTDICSNTAPT